MAEDGMLINFDLGSAPFNAKPTFKGGSWRDRRSAKKALDGGRQRAAKRAAASGGNDTPVLEKPKVSVEDAQPAAKRARLQPGLGSAASSNRVPTPSASMRRALDEAESQKSRQVISSLFTYNPAPKPVAPGDEEAADSAPTAPSNAPLNSDLDTFTSLGLSAHVADHLLNKMDIKAPTAIQRSAISQLTRENSDAFIQAETGSGKTLAYLLPIVERIIKLSGGKEAATGRNGVQRNSGLFAIILAPTRELSKQIQVVLESLLRCAHWIVSGIVIGGEKKKSEKARLRKGLNILIATPGRLADHLDHTEALDVNNVRWLVLDEGDRLMELGFEADIAKILSKLDFRRKKAETEGSVIAGLPSKRTTVLCSATMKMGVQKLGELSLTDAVHIRADPTADDAVLSKHSQDRTEDESFLAPAQLKQSYAIIPAKLRLVSLAALLKRTFARRGSVMKAIVFVSCADSVDFHFEVFSRQPASDSSDQQQADQNRTAATSSHISPSSASPVHVYRLHGSLPQALRTSTLTAFRTQKDPALLIATDVASRGLDLPNVDLVIELDPPFSTAEHLHRVGRTARAGRDGRALIFLLPGSEEGYLDALKRFSVRSTDNADGTAGSRVYRADGDDMLLRGFGGANKQEAEDRATDWQLDVERWVQDEKNSKIGELARRAFQSHIRAYATHVAEERKWFDMKQLHLGHLCKAFGVRDAPGGMNVPGLRGSKKGADKGGRRGQKGEQEEAPGATDEDEARRKMRKMAQMLSGGSSEFNLG